MSGLKVALNQRIAIEDYIVWSTVSAVLLLVPLRGTFMIGHLVVLMNALLLLGLGRLDIHRNHLIVLLSIAGFSIIGARNSGTTVAAIASQIVGIGLMSVYYFSILTNFQVTPTRWMEMYVRAAFVLAVLALIIWPIATRLTGDPRLRGIYSEPSYYVFITLPAVGYCINCFAEERRYGWESIVFLLTYALADSALGFLGIIFVALFAYAPRLKGWQILTGGITAGTLAVGVYAASGNVRLRINDLFRAAANQDLSGSGSSTFALLSNLYVTSRSFMAHPLTGIGIGGYANAYDKYIGDIHGLRLFFLAQQLNRDDANSMVLRVATELGISGLTLLVGFIIVCAMVRGRPYRTIRNAILPYLLIRMARWGHYFSTELYFFVGLYILNYLGSRANCRPKVRMVEKDREDN